MREKQIKEIMEKFEIKPSFHRFKILEYLINNKTHPTADDIYTVLSKEIPTLSKTTVYNTLNYFVSKGIVSEVVIEENEVRYDIDISPHIHFKCKKCGEIYDIFKKCEILTYKKIDEHKIEEYHIYLKGICRKCLKRKEE